MQITKYSPCDLNSRKPSFIKFGPKLGVLEQLQVEWFSQKMLKYIFLEFFSTKRAAKPTKVNTNVLKVKFTSI